MPYRLRISEDEVREELAKLGYTDVPDEMVMSFRKDLLKLIKNDLRKLKEERRLLENKEGGASSLVHPPSISGPLPRSDRTTRIPETSTPLSFRLKDSSRQQIPRSVLSDDGHVESGYSDRESTISGSSRVSQGERDKTSDFGSLSDVASKAGFRSQPNSAERDLEKSRSRISKDKVEKKIPVLVDQEKSASSSYDVASWTKSKTDPPLLKSSITGREKRAQGCVKNKTVPKAKKSLPSYPSRTDPVSLYHYYRAHWDKHKAPGEDPHSKLRWEVRTKLFYSS
ncbi:centriolar and ciliogenesis-associated protein HYLS1-like [Macrobrachium rosenbergii]|uniref:centriolar and ciliogenesis-associated protein HYLS1-like n=1 Tax=Macrobrachium rosenbergii TaxID=79674 RepID=UPI0034D3B3D8